MIARVFMTWGSSVAEKVRESFDNVQSNYYLHHKCTMVANGGSGVGTPRKC